MDLILEYLRKNWRELPIGDLATRRPCSCVVNTPRFRASAHVIFFVLDNKGEMILVAKMARLPNDGARLAREAKNLAVVHKARTGGFVSIPQLIVHDDCYGHSMLIETALQGRMMNPALVRTQALPCMESLLVWLVDFHCATAEYNERSAPIGRVLHRDFERDAAMLADVDNDVYELVRQHVQPLHGARLPSVFEHGDLSAPNILVLQNDGVGVVDWELAEPNGWPCMDLFFFLTFAAFARHNPQTSSEYVSAFARTFFGPDATAQRYVRHYSECLEVDREYIRPLFLFCWARYVSNLAQRIAARDGGILTSADTEWLQSNRYYLLLRYTLEHFSDLNLGL